MSNYFGSKATSGLCQPIIAMMPPLDTYIEAYLGGGAIMKRKPPALHIIGIDIDPQPLSNFDCSYPVDLVNDCAHNFLANYDYQGSELISCDPPYLRQTRTSKRRYRFEYTERDAGRVRRALCNAHHLRELEKAYEQDGQRWAKNIKSLLSRADKECPRNTERVDGKRGKIAQSKSRDLLARLVNYEAEVLRFMTNTGVPFTNNQGEN